MAIDVTDILRNMALPPGFNTKALDRAADEIDRLHAENERLREGLESEIKRLDLRPRAVASVRMKIRNRLRSLLNDGGRYDS